VRRLLIRRGRWPADDAGSDPFAAQAAAVPVCSPARAGGFWTHCSRAPHALAGRASDELESRNSAGGARGSDGSRGTGLRKVVSTAFYEVAAPVKFLLLSFRRSSRSDRGPGSREVHHPSIRARGGELGSPAQVWSRGVGAPSRLRVSCRGPGSATRSPTHRTWRVSKTASSCRPDGATRPRPPGSAWV
jgi:hypothetical protein